EYIRNVIFSVNPTLSSLCSMFESSFIIDLSLDRSHIRCTVLSLILILNIQV
ncbi:hypothetical protein K1T71_008311, partial [Dendrolimus kikuchii]